MTPRRPALVPAARRLADDLLGQAYDPDADELADWLTTSARFRGFVEAYHSKVRRKLRGAAEPEPRRDVRAELLAARLLLEDQRIDLAFEAYGSGRPGPDFTVTFRGERPFNLEVTRLHGPAASADARWPLLAKLRQLPPGAPNALLIAFEGDGASDLDVDAAAHSLRRLADRKDESFFVERGFQGTRGFYERYLRLGGVISWCEGAAGDDRATLWTNRSARIPLPDRAVRAAVRCLRDGP